MATQENNLPTPIDNYTLSMVAYSKHRGVSKTAIQRAVKENRVTENYSYILKQVGKSLRYFFNAEFADKEFGQNTKVNGNNIHSIAGEKVSSKNKADPPPRKNKNTEGGHRSGEVDIPSLQTSKEKEAYYTAELKRVKLEAELKNLISYDLVETIYVNMIIKFKKQIIATYPTFKTIIGKENADFVAEELNNILEQFSKLKKEDFEN